jgi:hypothetical protein
LNIDSIRQYFDFICNKYGRGYISGEEFNIIFNQEQTNYYDFLLGHVESYQPGRPVARIGVGSSAVHTKLSPFQKKDHALAVSSQQATKPSNFGKMISMLTSANLEMTPIDIHRRGGRINSTVLTAANNPFFVEFSTYWEIWPSTLTTVKVDYYPSGPDAVVWNYDDSSGREVYTSTGSVNPLWKDYDISAILARMFKAFAVSVDEREVMQFGQMTENSGG